MNPALEFDRCPVMRCGAMASFIPTITMTMVTDGNDKEIRWGVEIVAPADVCPFPSLLFLSYFC
jgi:hypothetical protein